MKIVKNNRTIKDLLLSLWTKTQIYMRNTQLLIPKIFSNQTPGIASYKHYVVFYSSFSSSCSCVLCKISFFKNLSNFGWKRLPEILHFSKRYETLLRNGPRYRCFLRPILELFFFLRCLLIKYHVQKQPPDVFCKKRCS